MVDDSEKDGHAEIVMDYVLSWTLRCADVQYRDEKPILYGYCREILARLLDITLWDDVMFEDVKVWKQEQRIDLWVELTVKRGDSTEQHAILIEDKYYDELHDGQLERYKRAFDAYYAKESIAWHKHYVLISCVERSEKFEQQYGIAPTLGFKTFTFYEVFPKGAEMCESDIFNEFWIRW